MTDETSPEIQCPLCRAGVSSPEHEAQCVAEGYAEIGEPVSAKALQLAHAGRNPPKAREFDLEPPAPPVRAPRDPEEVTEQPGEQFTSTCPLDGQQFVAGSLVLAERLLEAHTVVEHPEVADEGAEEHTEPLEGISAAEISAEKVGGSILATDMQPPVSPEREAESLETEKAASSAAEDRPQDDLISPVKSDASPILTPEAVGDTVEAARARAKAVAEEAMRRAQATVENKISEDPLQPEA